MSAARQGDNVNPKKESSGCQFYIVTGKVYNDSTLLGMESQMNENEINVIFNTLAQKHMKEIYKMRKEMTKTVCMNCRRSFLRRLTAEWLPATGISLHAGTDRSLYHCRRYSSSGRRIYRVFGEVMKAWTSWIRYSR